MQVTAVLWNNPSRFRTADVFHVPVGHRGGNARTSAGRHGGTGAKLNPQLLPAVVSE